MRYIGRSTPVIFCLMLLAMPERVIGAEDEAGAWITFSLSDAIRAGGEDTRWHYWVDAQARYFDPGSGVSQYLVRPAIGYRLFDGVKGWIGYARFRTGDSAGTVVHENRYWQQVDWNAGRFLGGSVSMRARLEQRSVSISDDVAVVFRFSTKYVRPIGADGRTNLIVGIEPFVDFRDTDWTGDPGLGQNRSFIGLGWRIGESLTVESGYMNQYIRVDDGPDRRFHHGVVNFNVRM